MYHTFSKFWVRFKSATVGPAIEIGLVTPYCFNGGACEGAFAGFDDAPIPSELPMIFQNNKNWKIEKKELNLFYIFVKLTNKIEKQSMDQYRIEGEKKKP